jgi:hypothetical protein
VPIITFGFLFFSSSPVLLVKYEAINIYDDERKQKNNVTIESSCFFILYAFIVLVFTAYGVHTFIMLLYRRLSTGTYIENLLYSFFSFLLLIAKKKHDTHRRYRLVQADGFSHQNASIHTVYK